MAGMSTPDRTASSASTVSRSTPDRTASTVIQRGARFDGLLTFQGDVRVEGRLDGEVVAEGRLEVGAEGEVRARVEVDELHLLGTLEGDVWARQRAELGPGARLVGTLRTPRPVLAAGATLEGRCETASAPPEVATEAPPGPVSS